MHLDKYNLPVQKDGDANDQLQRCGMISVGETLNWDAGNEVPWHWDIHGAINSTLQHEPGVYVRHVFGSTNNVSADQLIAALAAHVAAKNTKQVWLMFKAMVKRFGFAQNTKDGLNGDGRTKLPDFMLLRALPLFVRMHPCLWPLALFCDVLLVLASLAAVGPVWKDGGGFKRRDPSDVDDNNTVLVLAVCRERMPTPLSILACKVFAKLRPWNNGCQKQLGPAVVSVNEYRPVYGALRWYHRAESGGNPEIAELFKPICERYFQ